MKLIIIHGPPAAGKLTVARSLSEQTGYRLFHNHLSIDCTVPVFEFGGPAFWDINTTVRCEIIAEAARQNIDVIHTFCYARDVDDEYFRRLVRSATDNGGEVHVVLLHCDDEVRKQRIGNESRVKLRKLIDPASVDRQRDENLLFFPHPDWADRTLILDTSSISPQTAATMIIERFMLATRGGIADVARRHHSGI